MADFKAPNGLSQAQFKRWAKDHGVDYGDEFAAQYRAYRRSGDFWIAGKGQSLLDRALDPARATLNPFHGGSAAAATRTAAAAPTPTTQTPARPDVTSARSQNPASSNLTSGPFSATAATADLFGTSANGFGALTIKGNAPHQGPVSSPGARGLRGPEITPPQRISAPVEKSVDQWLLGLYQMDKPTLTALQWTMFKAGWYDPSIANAKQIKFGQPDPDTIKAYENALGETARYNAAGKTDQTIEQTIAGGGPNNPANAGAKSPAFDITNPINVQEAYRQAAASVMGGGASAADVAGFQADFANQESAAYDRYAQAGQDRAAGLGGAYVGRPNAEASAKDYILAHNQQDVVNYDLALRTMQFHDALKEL